MKVNQTDRVRQIERLALLGKMIATLMHDLRTPVSSLRMSLCRLKQQVDQSGSQYPELDVMERSIARLAETIQNAVDFARENRVKPSVCDVNSLLKRAVASVVDAHGHDGGVIEYELAESIPAVCIDEAQVERAVSNLVLNALEACRMMKGSVRVRSELREDVVALSVIDDGPGIPQQIRPKVFEPFFTNKGRGSGLGLAVVKEIAQAHGGSVSVDSGSQGTRFTVYLPVSPVHYLG